MTKPFRQLTQARSGVLYLLQEKKLTPEAVADLLYHQSGLKGLSGISHDMRERVRVFVIPTDEETMIARQTSTVFDTAVASAA